jgi:RNA polymerase sigma factor (sigma-70 family)
MGRRVNEGARQTLATLRDRMADEEGRRAVETATFAGELFEQHHRDIFNYCIRRLLHRQDAEDAVQTTYVYALAILKRDRRTSWSPDEGLSWLYSLANYACLNHFKTARRRPLAAPLPDPEGYLALRADGALPPAETVAEARALCDSLAALSARDRAALILTVWRGCKPKEAAALLGRNPVSINVYLARARRLIAERVGGEPMPTTTRAAISELRHARASEARRLHDTEGLSLTELAARFGVHKATIADWLAHPDANPTRLRRTRPQAA